MHRGEIITYKAVKTNARTLVPEIVEVEFEIRCSENLGSDWLYIVKGGVIGFESAELKNLVDVYPDRSVFATWTACMGTLNKYPRLEVPMSEIVKFLEGEGRISVEREYGYPKKIIWKDQGPAEGV